MRDRIEAWGQKTYIETFKERSREGQYSNKRAAELTQYVLRYQNLANKVMSGYSTSGLDKIEEEVGRFQYVKVFNAVRQLKDWTPLDMLYGTCRSEEHTSELQSR